MKVTYLGTTVLLFDDGEDQIIFDAHFTRPSMFKMIFGKLETDEALTDRIIEQYGIDRLRGIFLSHTHYDHALDAAYLAEKTGAVLIGSVSAMNIGRGYDIPEERLLCFDDEMNYKVGNFEIKVIPSVHSKAHWYNNDLGEEIEFPLVQPASKKEYKEGGSYDFLVKNGEKSCLIRPSFNYIKGQLDGITADVLFLGVNGLSKADEEFENEFFAETIEKSSARMVIPIHWDNFMKPLDRLSYMFPKFVERTDESMFSLAGYCADHDISCVVQLPMTSIDI